MIGGFLPDRLMLELVLMKTDIGFDEQYELGMNVCRFSEDVPLAPTS